MLKRTQNKQTGTGNVSLTSGDGTLAIVLKNPFPTVDYNIQLTFREDISPASTVHPRKWASAITVSGFTINVDSDSAAGDVDVDWEVSRKTQ